jgi:hypothetical protein
MPPVRLQSVIDLTQDTEQAKIDATALELTGVRTGQPAPGRPAPTQELGAALFAEPDIEGFCTLSAQVPYFQVLVVFPEKLQSGSLLTVPGPDGQASLII